MKTKLLPRHKAIRLYRLEEIIAASGVGHDRDLHLYRNHEMSLKLEGNGPFRVGHFAVILVREGELHLRLNLVEYRLPKDFLLVAMPNVVYEVLSGSNTSTILGANFTLSLLGEARLDQKHIEGFNLFTLQRAPIFHLSATEAATVGSKLEQLISKTSLPKDYPFRKEIILSNFSSLFYELAAIHRMASMKRVVQLTRKEELVSCFLKVLNLHFRTNREVAFYAHLLHVTPKYLSTCVKETTGKTAHELIAEMLVVETKILLHNSFDPISVIAEQLNFSDQFALSKFFKKHTGKSPSDYRSLH